MKQLEDGTLQVNESVNTIENCYDIILENEDYTVGKVIELILYTAYIIMEIKHYLIVDLKNTIHMIHIVLSELPSNL